ncbi:MAG: aldo/keto reductase [Deltaproteobacteria bacterium]|nr:aldo/keto reductase [Deltaproteobacteria bacterium]MBW2416579.1 aldo/keto reductase [Deltaproteobacteria bacterium]
METRNLGRTGLRVPALCMGTMTFGLQTEAAESCAILDRAMDGGVNFLDTADVYPLGGTLETVGRTEEIIGEWMRERGNRGDVLLATKCRGAMGPGPNDQGLSRQHIVDAVDASLRRLGTDYIDLYQTHYFDPRTPIEETLRALDDLIRSGRVRYVGCSNYPGWRLAEGLAVSERFGIARYESVQPRYNLLYREIETELLPLCRSQGLGVLVYNPLAGGFLSGKYQKGEEARENTRFKLGTAGRMYRWRYWQEAQFEVVAELAKLAESRGVSLVSLAVGWVLAQAGVSSAIIGASRAEQLDDSLAALDVEFDDELREACDAAWWKLPRRPVVEGYR